MAKGVRRGGARGQGDLDTFSRGELTAYVRPTRDLQTFKEFAVEEAGGSLGRDVLRFAGASILAEIVLLHAGPDPSPEVFTRLTEALRRIDAVPRAGIIGAVLAEGWMLVTTLGYEPQIDRCVHCGKGARCHGGAALRLLRRWCALLRLCLRSFGTPCGPGCPATAGCVAPRDGTRGAREAQGASTAAP